jgi:TRAP-type C4-dicarboxylate transport system permease small subunit
VVLIFAITIFIIGGGRIALDNMHQIAPALGPAVGLKMGHVYLVLPISGVFIILFAIEQLFEILLNNQPPKESH